jgi:hypothetical protein
MEQFDFEITLNYCLNQCTIKPPNSYSALLEIISEKFEVSKIDKLVYYNNNNTEIKISNESDYFKIFEYIDKSSIKDIEILIKSEQDKTSRKKSARKKSKNNLPTSKAKHAAQDDCLNGKNH